MGAGNHISEPWCSKQSTIESCDDSDNDRRLVHTPIQLLGQFGETQPLPHAGCALTLDSTSRLSRYQRPQIVFPSGTRGYGSAHRGHSVASWVPHLSVEANRFPMFMDSAMRKGCQSLRDASGYLAGHAGKRLCPANIFWPRRDWDNVLAVFLFAAFLFAAVFIHSGVYSGHCSQRLAREGTPGAGSWV